MKVPLHILPVIVVSQFCCTSLWFAGNGVMADLVDTFGLNADALGHLTSAVQFGFICGTLVFAILTIADRYAPSKVFMISAILGAAFNSASILDGNNLESLLALRFLTGFFLAGIYPIGMKIAADYYEKGLGKSLGYLVGALVLGTAFPHLLKGLGSALPWRFVLITTSVLACTGGLLMWSLVPNGPFRKQSQKFDSAVFFKVFSNRQFRAAAFGYLGHMWELYAFWAFLPVVLLSYNSHFPNAHLHIPSWSFIIIAIGSLGCVAAGYLSLKMGAKRIASIALFLSGACCLVSPLVFSYHSSGIFLGFLLFWGLTVIADSPLFSTLVAQNTLPETKGTALTIVNCLGFSLTIVSIQLLGLLQNHIDPIYLMLPLSLGPIIGLLILYSRKNEARE